MTMGVLRAVEERRRVEGKAGLRDVLDCGHDVESDDGYPHASRRCTECRPGDPLPLDDELDEDA